MFHPLERIADLYHVGGRTRRVDRLCQHLNHIGDPRLADIAVRILGLERLVISSRSVTDGWIDLSFGNKPQRALSGFSKSCGDAIGSSIIRKDWTRIAIFENRFAQAQHISAPVACDHCITAGRHDFATVGGEILDLSNGVQLVANDFDVRAFFREELHRRRGNSFTK